MSHAFDSSVGKASDKTTDGGNNNWRGQDLWNMSDWRQAFSQSGSTASDYLPSLGLSGNADGGTATGSSDNQTGGTEFLSKLENDFRTLLNDVRDFEKQSGMSPQFQSDHGQQPSDGRHHGGRKRHGGHGHGHCHSDGSNEGDGTTGPTGSASGPGDGASNSGDGSAGPAGGSASGPGDGASNAGDGSTGPAGGTASGPGDGSLPTGPRTPSDGSGFTVQNGKLEVNGQLVSGIAVTGEYVQQVGAAEVVNELKNQFPGTNTIRLATSPSGGAFTRGTQLDGGQSVADVENAVNTFTSAGYAVLIDNHDSDANQQPNIPTYKATEDGWFSQLASDLKGNNMVGYQPGNEPIPDYSQGMDAANAQVVDEQQSAYKAIRNAGSDQVVLFDLIGGGGADALNSNPGAYNQDYNYGIDAHGYTFGDPNWRSKLQNEVDSIKSANLTEADTGQSAPIYFGEVGVSGSTPARDNNPDQTDVGLLQTVTSDGTGATTWLMDGAATGFEDPNHLLLADGSVSSYGRLWNDLTANGTA